MGEKLSFFYFYRSNEFSKRFWKKNYRYFYTEQMILLNERF